MFATLLLLGNGVFAQQLGFESSSTATNASLPPIDQHLLQSLTQDSAPAQADTVVKKNLRISGPLVRPFKAKKIVELPKRVLHLINPFARPEAKEGVENTRELSSRAWTTTVGWHAGGSSFQDAVTHEPTMTLISVSHAEQ
jgi:hypothetical protein